MDYVYTAIPPLIPGDSQQSSGQFNDDVKVYGDLAVDSNISIGTTGGLTINSTVNSLSVTSGALIVAGGVGVSKQVTAGTVAVQSLNVSGNSSIGTAGTFLSFYGVAVSTRPTTSVASATFSSAGGGATFGILDTFGGYTIGQIVTSLKTVGLLT